MVDVPIKGEGNLSIYQSVIKDGILAVGFWGEGKTVLKVDVKMLGLKDKTFEVREVISGKLIANRRGKPYWTAKELKEGIDIEIKEEKGGKVIAIGKKGSLERFKGILP